ncbi:AlbA family DNA-binding domain-containing protein [Bosea beijingensis]
MDSLFDQLVAGGEDSLQKLVDERAQESLQLDFKTKADPTRARFSDDDKRVFGKALSAFSNSAGGLIIWGVDCRKGSDGLDGAQELLPISDIEHFYSEAVRLSGDLIIPRHGGVRVEKVNSKRQPGAGYLVVQVDRSERRPHRSEAKGDKQYYKRAGESSFPVEHYDIEDAFKRQSTPELDLGVRFKRGMTDGTGRVLNGALELFLVNTSNVSAAMPYLQERENFGARADFRGPALVSHSTEGEWESHTGEVSAVIHPGLSRTMALYQVAFDWKNSGCDIEGRNSAHWEFYSQCRFGCENIAASEKTIHLDYRFLTREMSKF